MQASTKQIFKSSLFEATFVVLGVVLALLANEWRQKNAELKASQQAVKTITQELQTNLELIQRSRDYHKSLLSTLFSPEFSPSESSIQLFSKGFVAPAQVTETAWVTASEIGVLKSTDYSTVLVLSRAYDAQRSYTRQSTSIGEIIYTRMFEGGHMAIIGNPRHLGSIISTMVYKEEALLIQYQQTLDAIAGSATTSPAA